MSAESKAIDGPPQMSESGTLNTEDIKGQIRTFRPEEVCPEEGRSSKLLSSPDDSESLALPGRCELLTCPGCWRRAMRKAAEHYGPLISAEPGVVYAATVARGGWDTPYKHLARCRARWLWVESGDGSLTLFATAMPFAKPKDRIVAWGPASVLSEAFRVLMESIPPRRNKQPRRGAFRSCDEWGAATPKSGKWRFAGQVRIPFPELPGEFESRGERAATYGRGTPNVCLKVSSPGTAGAVSDIIRTDAHKRREAMP